MIDHPCAVPTCDKRVAPEQLMCYRHWRQVPQEIRTKVTRGWHDRLHWREYGMSFRQAYDEWWIARKEAIAAILDKEDYHKKVEGVLETKESLEA